MQYICERDFLEECDLSFQSIRIIRSIHDPDFLNQYSLLKTCKELSVCKRVPYQLKVPYLRGFTLGVFCELPKEEDRLFLFYCQGRSHQLISFINILYKKKSVTTQKLHQEKSIRYVSPKIIYVNRQNVWIFLFQYLCFQINPKYYRVFLPAKWLCLGF